MATCTEVLARTLRETGITRMFGLPGGEILDFIEAGRKVGIEFLLSRHEATASFMADATGQIQRRPGVCVSTLGPGAVNMTLGVANAFLDRSPVIAITASLAASDQPYATHQNLDLGDVYLPFTKATFVLDGENTAAKVRHAYRTSIEPRMGPVHIILPSDLAREEEIETQDPALVSLDPESPPAPLPETIERMAHEIRQARRPVIILGLDLDPYTTRDNVQRFVDHLGVPVFVTPKAKGILPEDHPLFLGICGGVAADAVILDFFSRADLLVGVGFDPVESDKLWHYTMKLVSIGPISIASGDFSPPLELTGDPNESLSALVEMPLGPHEWSHDDFAACREELQRTLQPARPCDLGLSPWEVTLCLRELFPRDAIATTDVGSSKLLFSQAWKTFEPLTFLVSNGLSAMGYGIPAAMAAKLQFPNREVLCAVGDGGFAMAFADLETCVRHGIHFITVVFNDSALSLIRVVQEKKGYTDWGVRYANVDFAAASAALGAWSRRVETLGELEAAVTEGLDQECPVVIDVQIDPTEYHAHWHFNRGVEDQ